MNSLFSHMYDKCFMMLCMMELHLVQSEELTEWKSAFPGESEMYIFDAPGTPKFL